MKIQPIATSFTAAVLALTCALVLGTVVFSQSRAFRDSFERMAERDIRLLTEITAERLADALKAGDLSEVRKLATLRRKLGTWATHIETVRGIGYRLG